MSDTPTPDTDAEAMDGIDCYGEPLKSWDYKSSKDGEVVLASVARKLERERDEAREELARLRNGLIRLIRRWKRREKEYLNAVTPAFEMGDKCAGNRYYGESIGTHWAIEDLELILKRKEEA